MIVRNAMAFVASALALGVLALGGSRAWTMRERDLKGARGAAMLEDSNSIRQLVAMIVIEGELPMRDGALDPYFFVRNGDIVGSNIKLLRSRLRDIGPTEEEALRGDYTNFPFERYRGPAARIGQKVFPLLWEREPSTGCAVVGFSDGSARFLEREQVEEWGLDR